MAKKYSKIENLKKSKQISTNFNSFRSHIFHQNESKFFWSMKLIESCWNLEYLEIFGDYANEITEKPEYLTILSHID